MDNKKLDRFLDLATAWLERELKEPTLEEIVISQATQNIQDMGRREVFDKAHEMPGLNELINRRKSEYATLIRDAIVQTLSDDNYFKDVKERERLTKLAALREELEQYRAKDEFNFQRVTKEIEELEAKNG